jgi:hypothetical protein
MNLKSFYPSDFTVTGRFGAAHRYPARVSTAVRMLRHFFTGVGLPETALAVSRVAVGFFFLLSGYHKLFNAKRRVAPHWS